MLLVKTHLASAICQGLSGSMTISEYERIREQLLGNLQAPWKDNIVPIGFSLTNLNMMSEQDPQCPLDEDLLFLIQWPLNMRYTYRMPLLQTNPSKPGGECNKPNYGSTWFNY